jgi:hypothetical protein
MDRNSISAKRLEAWAEIQIIHNLFLRYNEKDDTTDYALKSSIFINVDNLWISGRQPQPRSSHKKCDLSTDYQ